MQQRSIRKLETPPETKPCSIPVCAKKTPIARVAVKLARRPPLPPKFNVGHEHSGNRAEMGVFFAPPERPWPYLANIELGERGRAIYIGSCSGWAFFSHTPVTDFCVISVPRGVAVLQSNPCAAVLYVVR